MIRSHKARQSRQEKQRRAGFSLLEVIIATAILMGSAVVLSRLAGMGREQANKAARYTTAQQVCEQTLHEVLMGLRSVEPIEKAPLLPLYGIFGMEDDRVDESADELTQETVLSSQEPQDSQIDETNPAWWYSVRTELLPEMPGMWSLTVEVVEGGEIAGRPVRFSLTRWIAGDPPPGAFDELMFREVPDELSPVDPLEAISPAAGEQTP